MPYTAVWRTHIRMDSGRGVDVRSDSVAKRSCVVHFMKGSYFFSWSLLNLSKYSVMRKSGAFVGASTPASTERRKSAFPRCSGHRGFWSGYLLLRFFRAESASFPIRDRPSSLITFGRIRRCQVSGSEGFSVGSLSSAGRC